MSVADLVAALQAAITDAQAIGAATVVAALEIALTDAQSLQTTPPSFFPPSVALGTSATPIPDPGSYHIWHNGGASTGPENAHFDKCQALEWTNRNGDWLDANGVRQGPQPWYSVSIPKSATGEFPIDVTALAQRWNTVANRGAFISVPTTTPYNAWAKIAGSLSATPPRIELTSGAGTVVKLPGVLALFALASPTARYSGDTTDASQVANLNRTSNMLLHFPGVESAAAFVKAEIVLTVTASDDVEPLGFAIYETDAPPLLMGGAGMTPTMGLAAQAGSEEALATYPGVFAAGDFREENWNFTPGVYTDNSLTNGAFFQPAKLFNAVSMQQAQYQKTVVVPDPDYPGRFALRTCVPQGQVSGGEFNFALPAMADETDPKRPMLLKNVVDELFVRVEVYLDPASFWSDLYAFKFSPVGQNMEMGLWDDRFGWDYKGGSAYVFGSGQTPSTGQKSLDTKYNQWLYKGHSCRGHMLGWPNPTNAAYKGSIGLGFAPSHLAPYENFFDGGTYGTEQNLRMYLREADGHKIQHVVPKGRWVTMESRVKLNSVDTTTVDALGNGTPNHDGILQVWMDGVLCGERTNLAWRCHPEMTIKSNWMMVYHGGNTPTDHDIIFWYRNFAIARSYIGPAVRPT